MLIRAWLNLPSHCALQFICLYQHRGEMNHREKGAIPLSTSHPILLHKDAHCTWQRNTSFVNHYLLINIYYVPLILWYFTVPVYSVLVFSFFSFFFKVYLLHNWWLLMTFSKWGKLLMIFKFIFIRENELP